MIQKINIYIYITSYYFGFFMLWRVSWHWLHYSMSVKAAGAWSWPLTSI